MAEAFERVTGFGTGIEFRAYDGSRSGPADALVRVEIRSPRAIQYLLQGRNDLGVARAYVSGDLQVHGDLHDAVRRLWRANRGVVPWRGRLTVLQSAGLHAFRPVKPPPEEVRPRGRRHSRRRDSVAVSHHYDVSNRFYARILGPSMAYSCAVYPSHAATLEEAQFMKFELVCRKLGLRPGMRLLDVGCGWGGVVLHAAQHFGVRALGVTLSRPQVEWGQRAIAKAGLSGRAEIRLLDYRDVAEGDFDAISSIGSTEHVGKKELPAYFSFLYRKLRPRGRLLNHCITSPSNRYKLPRRDGFINRYVFPDGELTSPGHITSTMHDGGFEVRHQENLREHYVRTLAAWQGNLEAHWPEAVREVGESRARVWLLYLAGARVGFDDHVLELHQTLGVKTEGGEAAMPLRPDWESAAALGEARTGGEGGRNEPCPLARRVGPTA